MGIVQVLKLANGTGGESYSSVINVNVDRIRRRGRNVVNVNYNFVERN